MEIQNTRVPYEILLLLIAKEVSLNAVKIFQVFWAKLEKECSKDETVKGVALSYSEIFIKLKFSKNTISRALSELIDNNLLEKYYQKGCSNKFYLGKDCELVTSESDVRVNPEDEKVETENIEVAKESESVAKDNHPENTEHQKITEFLKENNISQGTINNLLKLDEINLEKVKAALEYIKEQEYSEGALYQAIKENWTITPEKKPLEPKCDPKELQERIEFFKYFGGLTEDEKKEALELTLCVPFAVLKKEKSYLRRCTPFEFMQHMRRLRKKYK